MSEATAKGELPPPDTIKPPPTGNQDLPGGSGGLDLKPPPVGGVKPLPPGGDLIAGPVGPRDYFAGMAMQAGILKSGLTAGAEDNIAALAFAFANSMMKVRDRKNPLSAKSA